jgi:hypothetical protein
MNNKPKIAIIVATVFSILFLSACSSPLGGNKTGDSVDINARPSDRTQQGKDTSASNSVADHSASSNVESSNTTSEAASSTGQAANTTAESQKPQLTNGLQLSPSIKDIKVKAVYLTGPSGGSASKVDNIIKLAKTTEVNTVVLDIKEDGSVNYQSNVDSVKKYGSQVKYYNPEKLIKKFHDNGIYVIGRIVTFRDKTLAKKRADLGIKTPKGTLWLENGRDPWANPYFEEVWDYNIAIAKEAVSKGFDEIQFDYVRFPTGRKNDFYYGTNVHAKPQAISGFLAKAEKEIHQGLGVPVSADVFAIIIESKSDGNNIGQIIEEVGKDVYCISPMIYPSHYANASNGVMGNGVGQTINGIPFTKPDLEPYKVMYNALVAGKKKIAEVPDYKAKVRPYIQAFTAKYLPKGYYQTYGAKQIREQIKAVYDAGYEEWILWDSGNKYQEAYFEKK